MAALIAFTLMSATGQAQSSLNTGAAPGVPQSIAASFTAAAERACYERGDTAYCRLTGLTRSQLSPMVWFYEAQFQVGPNDLDLIKIYRVISEKPSSASRNSKAAMLFVHGSSGKFGSAMIVTGMADWLAALGIDVWGIDMRHANVAEGQIDFRAMAGWDYPILIGDIRLATRFARYERQSDAQSFGRINLVGWSLGASLVFAVANTEAALGPEERDVKGIVSFDTIYKLNPANTLAQSAACQTEASNRQAIAQGIYQVDRRVQPQAGRLALSDPDGPSPFRINYTNREFALFFGSQNSLPPFPFHLMASVRDPTGKPSNTTFTEEHKAFEVLAAGNNFNTRPGIATYFAIPCRDTPYDDHLADVRIPLLNIGIAGGFGRAAFETNAYLPNSRITTLWLQNLPDESANDDIGHMEPFCAWDMVWRVWEPLRQWLLANEQSED